MGARSLSYWQWGLESTRGTPVAATRKIGADIKGIPRDRVWEQVRLADGYRTAVTNKRFDQLLVEDALSFADGYFQLLPGLMQCCLDGAITPAEVNMGQSDYKWDIAPSLTAANAPKTMTLETGDDVQAYEIEYVMYKSLKFKGDIPSDGGPAPVSIEAPYFGRQVTPTTFTAGQALHPSLELMNAKLSRLYMDTSWAGLGGTEQTALLRGFELEFMTGNHHKPLGSANKYYDAYGEGDLDVLLTLILEGSSGADAIFDLYQAGTERAIRLDINGSQIGSGASRLFRTDLYGYFEAVEPLSSEVNGNNLHMALFRGKRDSSDNFLDIDVITDQNAV